MDLLRKKMGHARSVASTFVFLVREEHAFGIQIVWGTATLLLAAAFSIQKWEWVAVLIIIGMVLAIEALNTAIEEICDHITPEHHPQIGKIKDISAAASALFGVLAIAAGLVIFVPYFQALL